MFSLVNNLKVSMNNIKNVFFETDSCRWKSLWQLVPRDKYESLVLFLVLLVYVLFFFVLFCFVLLFLFFSYILVRFRNHELTQKLYNAPGTD